VRILHVVPSYIPAWRYGGPIHSVHGLCKALGGRGHQVEVATTNVDGDHDSDVPVDRPVDLEGVRVHYFPSTLLRRLYYSPRMYDFMAEGMPNWEIVHTHSVFLWPTTAAARLARKHRKPYVVSPRGMLVRDLIARRSGLLKKSWIRLFERKNIEEASAVHVTSQVEGDELIALGLKPRRTFDIPNGLDLPERRDPGEKQLAHGLDGYVLFLGRISWKKGLDRLIAALALVPDLRLIVAGNDDEDYWPRIEKQITELGVANRVRREGFVEGATKEALLSGARFLVLPSHSENFGNVVLEAMAFGIPVLVTPEVGLAGVVAQSRSGLVSAGDPESLATAMRTLAGDASLRAELGRNGRATAANYSWDSVAKRMEAEYQALVGSNG
jgi:glycosyltransferase involved in cell wall biosynthesis